MTTIKEYKAMMEGATDAPWSYIDEWSGIYDAHDIRGAQVRIAEIVRTSNYKENARFICASRNLAPSLIRVIELAEDALSRLPNEKGQSITFEGNVYYLAETDVVEACDKTLSEIRKLKG